MRKILPFILAMFLLAANTFAQSQATTGNIEGRVTDSNGAAVPTSVSATNQDNGFGKTTVTREDGNFVFVLLPPGLIKSKPPPFKALRLRPTKIQSNRRAKNARNRFDGGRFGQCR